MNPVSAPLRVVVWSENRHEKVEPDVAKRHPDGMHKAIQPGIQENLLERAVVRTVSRGGAPTAIDTTLFSCNLTASPTN